MRESEKQVAFNALQQQFPQLGGTKLTDYLQIDETTGEPTCTVEKTRLVVMEDAETDRDELGTVGMRYTTTHCLTCLAAGQRATQTSKTIYGSSYQTMGDPLLKEAGEDFALESRARACPFKK